MREIVDCGTRRIRRATKSRVFTASSRWNMEGSYEWAPADSHFTQYHLNCTSMTQDQGIVGIMSTNLLFCADDNVDLFATGTTPLQATAGCSAELVSLLFMSFCSTGLAGCPRRALNGIVESPEVEGCTGLWLLIWPIWAGQSPLRPWRWQVAHSTCLFRHLRPKQVRISTETTGGIRPSTHDDHDTRQRSLQTYSAVAKANTPC
jgi:hypothetical protein